MEKRYGSTLACYNALAIGLAQARIFKPSTDT